MISIIEVLGPLLLLFAFVVVPFLIILGILISIVQLVDNWYWIKAWPNALIQRRKGYRLRVVFWFNETGLVINSSSPDRFRELRRQKKADPKRWVVVTSTVWLCCCRRDNTHKAAFRYFWQVTTKYQLHSLRCRRSARWYIRRKEKWSSDSVLMDSHGQQIDILSTTSHEEAARTILRASHKECCWEAKYRDK